MSEFSAWAKYTKYNKQQASIRNNWLKWIRFKLYFEGQKTEYMYNELLKGSWVRHSKEQQEKGYWAGRAPFGGFCVIYATQY